MRCPHCDAEVPRRAKACPECGSDDRTGWASGEDIEYEAVEVPDAYDPDLWEREGAARERTESAKLVIVVLIVLGLLGALGILLRLR